MQSVCLEVEMIPSVDVAGRWPQWPPVFLWDQRAYRLQWLTHYYGPTRGHPCAGPLVPIPGGPHKLRGATWRGHGFLHASQDRGHRAMLALPPVPDREPSACWSSCRGWLERGESVRARLVDDAQEIERKNGSLPTECFAFPVSYDAHPRDFRERR